MFGRVGPGHPESLRQRLKDIFFENLQPSFFQLQQDKDAAVVIDQAVQADPAPAADLGTGAAARHRQLKLKFVQQVGQGVQHQFIPAGMGRVQNQAGAVSSRGLKGEQLLKNLRRFLFIFDRVQRNLAQASGKSVDLSGKGERGQTLLPVFSGTKINVSGAAGDDAAGKLLLQLLGEGGKA